MRANKVCSSVSGGESNSVEPCDSAPQVEDPKKVLLLYGNKTSQVVKDVLADIGKLKAVRLPAA